MLQGGTLAVIRPICGGRRGLHSASAAITTDCALSDGQFTSKEGSQLPPAGPVFEDGPEKGMDMLAQDEDEAGKPPRIAGKMKLKTSVSKRGDEKQRKKVEDVTTKTLQRRMLLGGTLGVVRTIQGGGRGK
eukprot:923485-Rhodomonas_salina.1